MPRPSARLPGLALLPILGLGLSPSVRERGTEHLHQHMIASAGTDAITEKPGT